MPLRAFVSVAALSLGLGGCGGSERLSVEGSARVQAAGDTHVTGFELGRRTRLQDDRIERADGRLAGHCVLQRGDPPAVDVRIARTDDGTDEGLRALRIRADDPEETARAEVRLGSTSYEAHAGAACGIESEYADADGRIAGVHLDCRVASDRGDVVEATAELHFAGCDVVD